MMLLEIEVILCHGELRKVEVGSQGVMIVLMLVLKVGMGQ